MYIHDVAVYNIMFFNALGALNPIMQESCQSDNDKGYQNTIQQRLRPYFYN